ncbi:MAG TPA: hypothetical protein DD670_09460, partial [Planctomycetaceae bacterium]|nr:hypothetical protein [Planctomycetaceae bacterium]
MTGATVWAYPSQQYAGIAPGTPYIGAPHVAYVNNDVTAINITNGNEVTKIVDDASYLTSSHLVLGGENCTLTLDNASKLTLGTSTTTGNFYTGVGTDANTTLNILGGSTLTANYAYLGFGGTSTVNIIGSNSSLTLRNGSRLGWAGGTGYLTVDQGTYSTNFSLRMGDGVDSSAELTVKNGGTVTIRTDFNAAYVPGSQATVTVDGGSIVAATDAVSYSRVGYEGNATMTVKNNGSFTTGHHLYLGHYRNGTLNVQSGGTVGVGMTLYLGRGEYGNGTLNIDGAGSSVTVAGDDIIVGHEGAGAVMVTNGGVLKTDKDMLALAYSTRGIGTLTLESGSVVGSAGRAYIGYAGEATCNMTDSTLDVGLDLRVGYLGTSVAALNVFGDSVVNVGRDFETFI